MTNEPDQVHLSLTLATSEPHTISISDANPASPLQLVASIRQTASPFPSRPITILTKYSCLDTSPSDDAFFIRAMRSPELVTSTKPESSDQAPAPAPELPLRPVARHITTIRVSGDPDLLKRDKKDGFTFLKVPPVGQGSVDVVMDLSPARLMKRLGDSDESVEAKLRRLLRPGDSYRVAPADLSIRWWAFGAVTSQEEKKTKVARWTLPDDLPLQREPDQDETDDVARRLRDLVDLHDVNYLSSRSAVEGEERPVVSEMRKEGWVFGEPAGRLRMVCEKDAVFDIVE